MDAIVTPSEFSKYTFDSEEKLVYRDSSIETIKMFTNEYNVVYVQGDEGWGKSSLLSQYFERNKDNCITLCIDPNCKYQYFEDAVIRDIYIQLKTLLGDLERVHDENVTKKDLIRTISTTEYNLKRERKSIDFVIDGLDQIPEEDNIYVQAIIDLLPIGSKNISFIFSIKNGTIKHKIKSKSTKEYAIGLFSLEESKSLMPTVSDDDLKAILENFGGVPERLSAIKNLIEQGVSIEDIIDNNATGTEGLFDEEWKQTLNTINTCKKELGIIAYSENDVSTEDLTTLFNFTLENVEELKKIHFIKSDEKSIKFKSYGFKKFAKNKLKELKSESIEKIIKALESRPSNIKSLTALASFYNEIGEKEKVVSQLSNENLELLFKETKSLNTLLRQIEIGINCATDNSSELLRLCHLKSLFNGITTSSLLKSEMKHLLLNDDIKAALDLANSSSSNEERLQMLCLLASDFAEKNQGIPENIERYIDELYIDLTPSTLGIEKTIDIAMDLFSFNPDYALSLINKIDALDSGGQNKSDYAFYLFTLAAARKDPEKLEASIFESQSISEKKKKAIGTIKHFKDDKPPKKIIEGLEEIESPGDRIFLLRNWIKACPERKDNHVLVEYMLDLAIKTTDFSTNATFCAELSPCLKHIDDRNELIKIYNKLRSQLETIRPLGPTLDYVKVLIDLYEVETKLNLSNRNENYIFNHITNNIKDKSIALASLCLLERQFQISSDLKDKINGTKKSYLNEILNFSANQFEILQEALNLQSQNDFEEAIEWASKLNTQHRRCEAYSYVISQYCESDYKKKHDVTIDKLCQYTRRIHSIKHKSKAISELINFFSKQTAPSKNDFNKIKKLAFRSKSYSSLCNFSARLLDIGIKKNVLTDDSITSIKEKLLFAWENLDGEFDKVDHGFKISNLLATRSPETSNIYKDYALTLRSEASIDNENVIEALDSSVDLAIRLLFLMVRSNSDETEDLSDILDDILRIPSARIKSKQLARLASIYQKNNRETEAKKIIHEHILPLIDAANGDFNDIYADIIYLASPVIYKSNQKLWDKYVEPIKNDNHEFFDQLVVRCIRYIMNDCLLGDPYDPIKNHPYNIDYSDIELLLSLIEVIYQDDTSFYYLHSLATAIKNLKKNNKLSTAQLNDIYGRYERMALESYPKNRYIEHDGYKILTKGLFFYLKEIKNKSDWANIISEAKAVPNKSDTAYILSILTELIPNSLRDKKISLLEESIKIIEKIPSYIDRLGRYDSLAEIVKGIDKNFSKRCIKASMVLTNSGETEDLVDKRLELIDAAYALDEDFPGSLSALYNDDPARKEIVKNNVAKKVNDLKNTKNFDPDDSFTDEQFYSRKYIDIAWKGIAQINANNHVPLKKTSFSNYLKSMSSYSYDDMYPLASYYIHLLGLRNKNKLDSDKNIKPLFRVIMQNSKSFFNAYQSNSNQVLSTSRPTNSNKQVLVDSMEENNAISFIKNWVSSIDSNSLLIVDPYFSIGDVKVIGNSIDKDPDFDIKILTGLDRKKEIAKNADDLSHAICIYWNENVSSGPLPEIEFLFAGAQSKQLQIPIHDRWWLSGNSGLRIGTSIGGLGKRLSEITVLDSDEVVSIEQRISGYLSKSQKMYEGQRMKYASETV